MHTLSGRNIWLIQSISIARIIATIFFALLVLFKVSPVLLTCLYAFAVFSDAIDGYLARKLKAETYFGKIMDLVADKSLSAVSLLYAAARGIDIVPLALIATRDIVMIGMRLVIVEGAQLLPTSKRFGGMMAILLWGNTLLLIHSRPASESGRIVNIVYWGCAAIFVANLGLRVYVSARRVKIAST